MPRGSNESRRAGTARDHNIFTPAQWRKVADSLALSPRELDIVQCIFDNLSEPQMGVRLGISVHTVHSYLSRLYRKHDVNSRCELILRVVAEHLALIEM